MIRDVCDRYSNTGFCAARHSETSTQQVCVRRAEAKEQARPKVNPYVAFQEQMKEYKQLAATNYPPRNFDSCTKLEGAWYAECAQRDGQKCAQASQSKGLCSDYVIPDIQSSQSCNAPNRNFRPKCQRYETAPGKFSCAQYADYGTCRAVVDEERTVGLFELDSSGAMKNPAFLKRGKSRAAFDQERKAYVGQYPPKDLASCRKLEGSWSGACTRKDGGKCVQVSRTEGQCFSYVSPHEITGAACDARNLFRKEYFSTLNVLPTVSTRGARSCAQETQPTASA